MGEPNRGRQHPPVATLAPPLLGADGPPSDLDDAQANHRDPVPGDPSPSGDLGDSAPTVLDEPSPVIHTRRPSMPAIRLTMETTLYAGMIVLAALTRFWDLGARTLHHDESLHTYYSWLFATGQGYVHDPLMHGPFLFHANAFVYLLFGASDATSRIVPALFGTVLVGLPWFLRGPRHLGRWGALAASLMLLLSPSLLYQSRYIRHDIYTVVGALVLFIAVVRFVDRPARRWLVTAGAAIGFLLTNHEIVFGIAAFFVAVLWGALLWDRLRPLVPLHLAAGVVLTGLWVLRPGPLHAALPGIPWSRDGSESLPPTRENQLAFYWEVFTHPLFVAIAAVIAIALGAGFLVFVRTGKRPLGPRLLFGTALLGPGAALLWAACIPLLDETGQTTIGGSRPLASLGDWRFLVAAVLAIGGFIVVGRALALIGSALDGGNPFDDVLGGAPRGSVTAAAHWAARHPASVGAAFTAGALIFVFLYTSLFSNVEGLVTGTIATDGTLLYWLGQHEYRRGNQPWFYYLLLTPQYEAMAVLFGVPAAIGVGVSIVRSLLRRAIGPRSFFRVFVAVWFTGILASLSWAGEKMPWLIVHITLPAILLAASLVGGLVERWTARPSLERPIGAAIVASRPNPSIAHRPWGGLETGLFAAFLITGGAWFFLAGRLSSGSFANGSEPGGLTRVVSAADADRWWLLALPPVAALLVLVGGTLAGGTRRAGRAAFAGLFLGLVLLQIQGGWRTAFQEGDVPKDMLIYTQTSPDVSRMMREVDALSAELTGGKGIDIWYDSDVSWPLQWYLRDYPNRELRNGPLAGPPDDVPIVIVGNGRLASVEPFLGEYTAQEYVLRWWFPESIYRDFAIAPELDASWSAWDGSDEQRTPAAVLRSIADSAGSLLKPEGQQDLYRLLMYRDLPTPIGHRDGTYRYTVFVRNDLLPLYNTIRY